MYSIVFSCVDAQGWVCGSNNHPMPTATIILSHIEILNIHNSGDAEIIRWTSSTKHLYRSFNLRQHLRPSRSTRMERQGLSSTAQQDQPIERLNNQLGASMQLLSCPGPLRFPLMSPSAQGYQRVPHQAHCTPLHRCLVLSIIYNI